MVVGEHMVPASVVEEQVVAVRVVGEHMMSMSVVAEHVVPVSVVEGHMVRVVCLRLLLHPNQMHLMIQTHRSVEIEYTPSIGLTFPPVDVTFL